MAGKRKISAKELAGDIRAGVPDRDLLKKYGLSQESLRKAFDKLVSAGMPSREDVQKRSGPPIPKPEDFVKCPSCGLPQPRALVECPNCGVIMSGFADDGSRKTTGARDAHQYPAPAVESKGVPWGAIGVMVLVAIAVGISDSFPD